MAEKSYLFFIKKRNKLIINCILIAAILFFMNYATLTICKVLLELPFPFVLSSPGLRLIMIIWLVEIVIVSLSIMNAFYRQLVILHEKTMKLEESSIKAQYTALQNQLNPHFLFNSLNTLISEIEYNPENAVVFTQKLSDVYRYILKVRNKDLLPYVMNWNFWIHISICIKCVWENVFNWKTKYPHVIEQENSFINSTVAYRKCDKT